MELNAEVMKVAALAVGKVVLLGVVGVLMSWYPRDEPLLEKTARKAHSRVLVNVFTPALASYTLLSAVDLESMAESWPLLVWGALAIVCGATVSYVTVYLVLGMSGMEARGFFLAGSFGNTIGLPLLLVASVCEQPMFRDEYGASCQSEGYGMVILSSLTWRILLFGVAVPWLRRGAAAAAAVLPDAAQPLNTPDNDGTEMSTALPSIATERSAGDASVDGSVEEGGAGVAQVLRGPPTSRGTDSCGTVVKALVTDHNVVIPVTAVLVALVPGSRAFLLGEDGGAAAFPVFGSCLKTLGEPVVCIVTLCMAAALLPKGFNVKDFTAPHVRREVAAVVLIRFLLLPAVGFAIVTWAARSLGLPGSRLKWLVAYLQFCVPPPQMVIINLVNIGQHSLAERLGPVFASTYLISIVTVTLWMSLALSLLESHDPAAAAAATNGTALV